MRSFSVLRQTAALALFVFATIAAATQPAGEAVDQPTPIRVTGREGIPVLAVTRVSDTLTEQEKVGDLQNGWFCHPFNTVRWNPKLAELIGTQIKTAVSRELELAGYRTQKSPTARLTPAIPA